MFHNIYINHNIFNLKDFFFFFLKSLKKYNHRNKNYKIAQLINSAIDQLIC